MTQPGIDDLSHEEFEKILQDHITWASEWDTVLPAQDFFGLWADLQEKKQPVALKAHIVQGRLEFTAPAQSAIKTVENRIYLEDGRELIIDLEPSVS
jgi:hypothetical protein